MSSIQTIWKLITKTYNEKKITSIVTKKTIYCQYFAVFPYYFLSTMMDNILS